MTKTYKIGEDIYDIPENEVQGFLKDNSSAVEIKSFTVGKDTFDIPIKEVDQFLRDMPAAKELKKKEELPSGEMPEVGGTRLSLSGFKQNTLQGGLTDTIKESLNDNLLTKEDKSQFSPGILKEQSLSMPGSEMISSNIPDLFKKDPYAGLEYGLRKQSEERLARENRYRGTIAGNINWEDESTAKKIAGGFATGMASLPGNVINALDYMYKIATSTKDALLRQGGKEYKDVFDEFKENDWWKQYRYGLQTASQEMMGGSIVDQWKSGDIKGAIESAVVGAAQSLPLTLAAMFGGPMGLTSVGLVAAGEKYDTLSETDLPMANKLLNATITGSLEAATESITQGYGKVLEGIFQREGKKIGKDIIKQGFKGWLYQPLKRLGIYTAPVGESLSEGINGWSEYLTDVAFGIEEYSSDNAKRAFLDNAAIGLPMGSTFSIVGASGKLIKPASKTRAENENIKKELKDKAKVPEDEKELYMDKVLKDVPKEYAEPVRKQIAELLIKKDELQQKQEEAGEKMKPVFDKQIKAVDNAISDVVNAAEGFVQDTETKGDQLIQKKDEKQKETNKERELSKTETAKPEQVVEETKAREEKEVKVGDLTLKGEDADAYNELVGKYGKERADYMMGITEPKYVEESAVDTEALETNKRILEKKQEIDPILETIEDSHFSLTEKAILKKQYLNGVMSDEDVLKYTSLSDNQIKDIQKGKIDKWANVLLNSNKQQPKKGDITDIEYEDIQQKEVEPVETEKGQEEETVKPKEFKVTRIAGLGMGQSQASGTYYSTEEGNRYETVSGKKAKRETVVVENPIEFDQNKNEFTNLRNEVLQKNTDKFEEVDFDGATIPERITVDDLSESGLNKLGEFITEDLRSKGHDSILFTGEGEGELVVFPSADEPRILRSDDAADKNRSVSDIDAIAQEISEVTGQEVTPQDIVDTILNYPSARARKTTDLQNDIRNSITFNQKDRRIPLSSGLDWYLHNFVEEADKIELTKEELSSIDKIPNKRLSEIQETIINGEITSDNIDQLDWLFNNKEDFEIAKKLVNDEFETKEEPDLIEEASETVSPKSETETAGTRKKLDQEINDLKDQLVKAKQKKQDKIAEFNSRKGLFGDTKKETEGTTLFEAPSDLSQENLNKFIQTEENVIQRLSDQISKLESTKEIKIKESEGQQKLTTNAKTTRKETGKVSPTEVRDNDKREGKEVDIRNDEKAGVEAGEGKTREQILAEARSKEELNELLGNGFKFSDKDWQKAVGEAEKKGWYNKEDVNIGTSYGYASTNSNTKTIDDLAKELTEGKRSEDFKVSDRVRKILNDLGVPVAEKQLPSRYAGLYKLNPQKIRVQAAFDIVVATHEAAHYISDKAGLLNKIKGNKLTIKDLTNIYTEFYPGAKKSHPTNKRIEEGIATLLENYFTNPNEIGQKYPRLVNDFINPKGKYYDTKFTQLLTDMNTLVDDYAKLSPDQKIGSRIIRGREIIDKDKGFNVVQRIKYEYFNRFEPLSRIGKKGGVSEEISDPYIHAFQWMNRGTFIHDWIKGNSKLILGKDGNWISKKGTVRDYLKLAKGYEKEFETYLVSRRVLSDYNSMIKSQDALNLKKSELEGLELGSDEYNNVQRDIINLQDKVDKISNILKNDAFNIHEAATVVNTYKNKFSEAEKIFDDITKSLIDFSENTGLLSKEIADEYRMSEGYAPMFRFINDELIGDNFGNMPSTNSQTKAKMFKERTGSKLDIVSPVYNQMLSINEVINKGLENNIWRNVAKLADNNIEIARRFEKMESKPLVLDNGMISYPQDKDPSLIKVMINGQRNYYMAAPELLAVSKNLRGEEWNVFSKMIRLPSALFTRLTTSANPLFALGNLPVDQVSAYIQSKTGYIPGVSAVDSFVEMAKSLKNINSDEETLFRKYIRSGGRRQTFAAFHNLSPEETIAKISGEKTFDRVLEKMDLGLSVLEFPSNSSEYMSRFAEYKRAINMGKTETEAMFMASQVTVPFQLYGNWHGGIGKTWIKSLPYFNAALQVNYKFLKSAKENPEKVAIMGSALLGTSLTMAALVFSSGSDEQKRLLANMPARELARAIFFPHPLDKKKLIRIRIPENLGAFTGLGYLFAIQHYTKQKARYKDYVDTTTAFIPDQFNPLKPEEMIFSWIPQALSPSIETAANVRTYPELSPIVPEYMIESQPPELQYYEYTTNVAKKIGALIGVSPAKTEYWVRNQFGAVGGMAIGKFPNNPLILQEEHHVTRGRSYSYFYDDKNFTTQEYNSLKLNTYSEEEKNGVIEDYVLYNKMSDVLSNMRRTIQINKDIPELIKQQSFELLVKINNGERGDNIYKEVVNLNDEILDFVSENKIDIGRTYKVTISSIHSSIRDYKKKNENKK